MEAKTINAALNNFIVNIVGKENFYTKLGKVKLVDMLKYQFVYEPNDGGAAQVANMAIVESKENAFILVPQVDSLVLVGYTDKETGYCITVEKVSEILLNSDKVTFNDGTNEGLINIIDQTTKLNDLIAEMQAELVKIQTGIVGAGGAYVPGTLTPLNKTDFEDTKIKH